MNLSSPSLLTANNTRAARPSTGLPQGLQALGRRLAALSAESRWAIAGLLLAQVMVVLLYSMLVDNVTQIGIKRAAEEELTRQRHYCTMLNTRLERQQCLAELSTRVE